MFDTRPLHPGDHAALKLLHQRLFPLDYDDSFYHSAVHGLDGIVAWAASAPLPALTHVSLGADALAPQLHQMPPPWQQQPYNPQQPLPPQQQAGHPEVLAGFITGKCEAGQCVV